MSTTTPSRPTPAGPATTPKATGAPVGPGSLLWDTAGDPRGLLTGTAAGMMQLMLPGLGAGVTDHSNFFEDPFDRIFRSIPYIWRSHLAADDEEGARAGRTIRDYTRDIKGHRPQRQPLPHALDPDIFCGRTPPSPGSSSRPAAVLPAPAAPLRASRSTRSVTWYRRYGVSDRPVPPTLDAFSHSLRGHLPPRAAAYAPVQWALDPKRNSGAGARRAPARPARPR